MEDGYDSNYGSYDDNYLNDSIEELETFKIYGQWKDCKKDNMEIRWVETWSVMSDGSTILKNVSNETRKKQTS